MLTFFPSSVFCRLRRHRKHNLLGTSQKNARFRASNLLPQKLESFADFAEISDFVNKVPVGLFFYSCFGLFLAFSALFTLYEIGQKKLYNVQRTVSLGTVCGVQRQKTTFHFSTHENKVQMIFEVSENKNIFDILFS